MTVRVDSPPSPLPYGQLFAFFFGVQVFFGAKTLFWALFSVFLMDQNPFLMTSTRICGNTINHCFKGAKERGLLSPQILSCSSFPPGGLWAFTDTQLMIKITRRLPRARWFVRLSWKAAQQQPTGGGAAQFANSCKFLERAPELCAKLGRQPVKPVGGTGIRGNLHGIKVNRRAGFHCQNPT